MIKPRSLRVILLTILLSISLSGTDAQDPERPSIDSPEIRDFPVLTEKRIELLKDYASLHFGMDSAELTDPRMIVVHYTAMASLQDSLATFKPDKLPSGRTDIAGHGDVNVGVHYLIAKDGSVYRLQPENVIGRHAIGFNWCAIGIEMVARKEGELTVPQLESCAALCAWIASRHQSIEYLIGHHEYMMKDLPHFALFLEKDAAYRPTVKIDPGEVFMKQLRQVLSVRYALTLKN